MRYVFASCMPCAANTVLRHPGVVGSPKPGTVKPFAYSNLNFACDLISPKMASLSPSFTPRCQAFSDVERQCQRNQKRLICENLTRPLCRFLCGEVILHA